MGKNLEIPSEFLRITSGPYKGLYGWYKDRIMRGRIVSVILCSSGLHVNLPIQCVVFIDTNTGDEYQYSVVENDGNRGYVLEKTQKDKDIYMFDRNDVIPVVVIDNKVNSEKIFLPDPEELLESKDGLNEEWGIELYEGSYLDKALLEDVEEQSRVNTSSKQDSGKISRKEFIKERREKSKLKSDPTDFVLDESESDYLDSELQKDYGEDLHVGEDDDTVSRIKYGDFYDILKDKEVSNTLLDKIVMLLALIGLEPDKTASIAHFNTLNEILKQKPLNQMAFDDNLYSLLTMAYIFIHINNLNIGYPLIIQGCKVTSNDDPEYIICACVKTKFIKNFSESSSKIFIEFVKIITKTMNIEIIPSINQGILDLSKKTSMMYLKEEEQKVSRTKKPKLMRFPLPDSHALKKKTLDSVVGKVKKRLLVENDKKIRTTLKKFSDNPEKYIKGKDFLKIKKYPNELESLILSPYITEYKNKLFLEEEKFYDKPKTLITTGQKAIKIDSLKLNLRNIMIQELNNTTDPVQKQLQEYLVDNLDYIVSLSSLDIKMLKNQINTENLLEQERIKSIIKIHSNFKHIIEKYR